MPISPSRPHISLFHTYSSRGTCWVHIFAGLAQSKGTTHSRSLKYTKGELLGIFHGILKMVYPECKLLSMLPKNISLILHILCTLPYQAKLMCQKRHLGLLEQCHSLLYLPSHEVGYSATRPRRATLIHTLLCKIHRFVHLSRSCSKAVVFFGGGEIAMYEGVSIKTVPEIP